MQRMRSTSAPQRLARALSAETFKFRTEQTPRCRNMLLNGTLRDGVVKSDGRNLEPTTMEDTHHHKYLPLDHLGKVNHLPCKLQTKITASSPSDNSPHTVHTAQLPWSIFHNKRCKLLSLSITYTKVNCAHIRPQVEHVCTTQRDDELWAVTVVCFTRSRGGAS